MMALAARHFAPYDAAYAARCLEAARGSHAYLRAHQEDHRFVQGPFRTGGYGTRDADDRLWATAELWETTGDEAYLRECEDGLRAARRKVDENWDWSNVHNLGAFRYVLSGRAGRDDALLAEVRREAIAVADGLVAAARADVYGRPLGGRYFWGCNGTVARQVVNLQVANRLAPNPDYEHAALDAIAHVFGRNAFGRSYVTGVGARPPMHPHDRRSEADGIAAPWPGYLVGGPNRSATNWHDDSEDFRTNEIAINWQAALVYALAGFAGNPDGP
jgi:endoglucanase